MVTEGDEGRTENRYLFTTSDLAPLLSLDEPMVELRVLETKRTTDGTWQKAEVINTGTVAAVGWKLEDVSEPDGENFLYFRENYLYLLPGERKVLEIAASGTREPEYTWTAF